MKYGRHIQSCEAKNMRFVSENTNIRLLVVIDTWEVEDKTPDDDVIS